MNNLSRSSMSEKDINDQSSQYPLLVLSYDSRKGTVTPWSEKTKVNLGLKLIIFMRLKMYELIRNL